jgi:uncharacterized membrane protein
MKKLNYILVILPIVGYLILNLSSISCSHEPYLIETLDTVCFETEIFPLLNASCGTIGCHSSGSGNSEFNASNYASIIKAVKAGDSKKSLLYEVITRTYGQMMPPDQPLTKEQRTQINVWIEQGALNTSCDSYTVIGNDTNGTNPIDYTDSICFNQDVQPLINSSCATTNCHDVISHKEGYTLTTYENIMSKSDGIRPFLPNESKIYTVLNQTGGDRMPPSPFPALSSEEKEVIRKWIADGALNSDCPSQSCDTLLAISFADQIWPTVNRSCVGCHSSSFTSGGIILDSYSTVLNVANTQQNGTSLLLGAIRKEAGFIAMPPTGTLDDCTIRQFELWIEQGSQNN